MASSSSNPVSADLSSSISAGSSSAPSAVPPLLSAEDLARLAEAGRHPETVSRQLQMLARGPKSTPLTAPCTIGDGILRLSPEALAEATAVFEAARAEGRVMKFVPASGASTRMFKSLLALREAGESQEGRASPLTLEMLRRWAKDGAHPLQAAAAEAVEFFENLDRFALKPALLKALGHKSEGGRAQAGTEKTDSPETRGTTGMMGTPEKEIPGPDTRLRPWLDALLGKDGLDYASKPKGLIPFHWGESSAVLTPLDEHLSEGVVYGADAESRVRIEFTVPQNAMEAMKAQVEAGAKEWEAQGFRFEVTYSVQKPETDTPALGLDGKPFRDKNGALVFRPGGHGALLRNLEETGGDLVFIKNIDNLLPRHLRDETYAYKKAMGGLLVGMQKRVFACLERFDGGKTSLAAWVAEAEKLAEEVGTRLAAGGADASAAPGGPEGDPLRRRAEILFGLLNRPLRVCAMVRNTGEAGGGPFWVRNRDGHLTLQVVEPPQVDLKDPEQKRLLETAPYFNPTDLVCGLRDYKGRPFPLQDRVDEDACFIAKKSKDGRDLLALELPGLWNGSMAGWNSVFVEAPVSTFAPVKTVNDLLRPEHGRKG